MYDNLRDKINAFSDLARSYGYDNIDSTLNDLREFELHDPRRICKYYHEHIYDRYVHEMQQTFS